LELDRGGNTATARRPRGGAMYIGIGTVIVIIIILLILL
jgi:hypothetical protein